jgi:hypothetical protein
MCAEFFERHMLNLAAAWSQINWYLLLYEKWAELGPDASHLAPCSNWRRLLDRMDLSGFHDFVINYLKEEE